MTFFRSSSAAVSFDKDRYRRLRNRALDPNRRVLVVALRVGCFRIALSTDSCAAILCAIGDCV